MRVLFHFTTFVVNSQRKFAINVCCLHTCLHCPHKTNNSEAAQWIFLEISYWGMLLKATYPIISDSKPDKFAGCFHEHCLVCARLPDITNWVLTGATRFGIKLCRRRETTFYVQCIFLACFKFIYCTYVVGSKSFRPDIQKPRQMENAVKDIYMYIYKGRVCWKIAKLFYFCQLKKLVRPENFGPCYVLGGEVYKFHTVYPFRVLVTTEFLWSQTRW